MFVKKQEKIKSPDLKVSFMCVGMKDSHLNNVCGLVYMKYF